MAGGRYPRDLMAKPCSAGLGVKLELDLAHYHLVA